MELSNFAVHQSEEELMEIKKGPWTIEEDSLLMNSISIHGEGRWNSLARFAGLKRTGKSCRLRWLNYLRPDVHRGNITLQEQLLILELHSRWGNRWSKIAQQLPGRTDNEIKNYWRTRVQKHAKQLNCDVNSKKFRDAMKNEWIPRLVEKIQMSSSGYSIAKPISGNVDRSLMPEMSNGSSSETQVSSVSDDLRVDDWSENFLAPEEFSGEWYGDGFGLGLGLDFPVPEMNASGMVENLWSDENLWFLRQQLLDEN